MLIAKKLSGLILLLLAFSATGLLLLDGADANPYVQLHLPEITVNSDGTVTPKTAPINQTGNIYTLTADIVEEYAIKIMCSDIVFDGAGHAVDVTVEKTETVDGSFAAYMGVGINLQEAHNVVVKNVKVAANNVNSINIQFSHKCQIINVTTDKDIRILGDENLVTQSNGGVAISGGKNNVITKNNITNLFVGPFHGNKFYQNNFYLEDYPEIVSPNIWDNGSVGNFWANYTAKYPNASEVGTSGIGDTAYTITRGTYTTQTYPDVGNIDHYPLIQPWGAPEVTLLNIQKQSYPGSVPLNFSINKPTQWIKYSVDSGENVTLTGNTMLEGLAAELHNVTVYASDSFGEVGASETAEFTIAQGASAVVPVAAISVAAASVALAAAVFYLRRPKKK